MKQTVSDTYNIAWFKLAECVSRGEKERALGVYRLLAHSLNDAALARQLEGDILLSFNTQDALLKYQDAADCYAQSGRLFKAACIYEHMLLLDSQNNSYHTILITLYTDLNMKSKAEEHAKKLDNKQTIKK
ncbi:MAG: hypothetical protein NT124_01705 [Candidatus Dependentiae bacterium]|nr:hypothetical protein [Candidatus Dependentiae bacterium]